MGPKVMVTTADPFEEATDSGDGHTGSTEMGDPKAMDLSSYQQPMDPDHEEEHDDDDDEGNVSGILADTSAGLSIVSDSFISADKGVEMEVEVDKVVTAADIPKPYQHLQDVFDEVEADKLPHHTKHDLHLELIEGGKPPQGPLYLKGPKEMSKLRRCHGPGCSRSRRVMGSYGRSTGIEDLVDTSREHGHSAVSMETMDSYGLTCKGGPSTATRRTKLKEQAQPRRGPSSRNMQMVTTQGLERQEPKELSLIKGGGAVSKESTQLKRHRGAKQERPLSSTR
ncbi:hypothetical protein NDA11_003643 [Ustilago hordei]|nr:hypothetical protein NDA11_003643 [Ustilago hordei]